MKIAIMQPYFFPYLGYFDLLHNVDLFVVYDTVQYIRRGWMHRNRVLHQSGIGWQYIIMSVEKAPQRTPISEIRIKEHTAWKERLFNQLAHYKHAAPYAAETIDFLDGCLQTEIPLLSRLNVHILEHCSRRLNVDFTYQFCSDLRVELDPELSAETRILELCKYLGVSEYINLPGGAKLYHPDVFAKNNIKLTFRHLPTLEYRTGRYAFEPNLSIIDVLMWKKTEDIRRFLDAHKGV
jgi:hypothetical protein